jgi:hypothetical protein
MWKRKGGTQMGDLILISRIFGPLLVIASFWYLTYRSEAKKIIESVKKTPILLYFIAMSNLFIGLLIVNFVPRFEGNITFFLPLLGWITIIRGFLALFFPGLFTFFFRYQEISLIVSSLIGLAWGLIICWIGFSGQIYM